MTAAADVFSSPVAPRRARSKRGHGEQLRQEILDAAERLLSRGAEVDEVSMRAVAEEVGCTAPALYLHFADRAELMLEVCKRHVEQLAERVDLAVAGAGGPIEALAASMRAYVRFGLDFPEPYRMLFMRKPLISAEQAEGLRTQGVIGFDRLEKRCHAAIASGAVDIDDVHTMALGVWMTVHGVVALLISRPAFAWGSVDAVIDHAIDTHLAGLRCRTVQTL